MALAMQHSLAASGVSAETADAPRLLSGHAHGQAVSADGNKKRTAPPLTTQMQNSTKLSVLTNRTNTKDAKRAAVVDGAGASDLDNSDTAKRWKPHNHTLEVRKAQQSSAMSPQKENIADKENNDIPNGQTRRSFGKRAASELVSAEDAQKKRRGNVDGDFTVDILPKESKQTFEEEQEQIEDERLTISQTRSEHTSSTKLISSASFSPSSSSVSSSLFLRHSRCSSSSSSSPVAVADCPLSPVASMSSFSQFADFSFYLTRSCGLKYALTVMEFLSPKDIFSCACVCRVWAILLRKGNTAAPPATHALTEWNNNFPTQPKSSRVVLFQNTSDEHANTPFNDFSSASASSVLSGASSSAAAAAQSSSPVQVDRSLQTAGHRLYHHAFNLRESLVIYRSLQARQLNIRVRSDYMKFQRDYNAKMRTILTDWMLQVNMEFDNDAETAALAVRMCDSLFSGWEIQRKRIQLVGVTCILLASKLLETHYPDLKELLYLCDGIYDRPELLRMESEIVKRMTSHMQAPTALTFYRHFQFHLPLTLPAPQCLHGICAQDLSHLAHEVSLLEYDFIGFEPCVLGCALYIFGAVYSGQSYHEVLEYTGYSLAERDDLNSCCKLLDNWVKNMHQMQLAHIEKRYKDERKNILRAVQRLDYALIVECNRAVQSKQRQEQADIIV